jgi:hypothetical protein
MPVRSPWLLLAGDLICLSVFVVLGLRTHNELAEASALARFLINVLPLALAWTLAALALGALRWPAPPSLRAVLARTLTAWLVAAPLALLLRALWLRSSVIVVPFMLVTLAVGGGLLLLWRALFFAWSRSR